MSTRQRIAILGSTGSIGVSTLDVVARHPERFEVIGLTAFHRIDELLDQCEAVRPRVAVVPTEDKARRLREGLLARGLRTEVQVGADALCALAADSAVDTVMAAIVGAAGLAPCLAAARAGKRLLLANKEALVVGGALFMRAVEEGGATLLPIDSEHSAIFQCLPEHRGRWAVAHRAHRADGFRRAVPHPRAGELVDGHAGRSLRPPELGHGSQDLGRLGDDDEQGARGDRGALAVRPDA